MAPLIEAQKLIAGNARRAEERADGVTVDLYRQLTAARKAAEADSVSFATFGVAREAKNLLN